MKKRGFTLIELLAVIVILAVVALIATPIVLNVIDDAKESGRRSSVALYADAIRLKVTEDWFKNGAYPKIDNAYLTTIITSGEKVTCEEAYYSEKYETVLHKCKVETSDKEYYFAGKKIYTEETDEYKNIYNSLENIIASGNKLAEELLKQYGASNTVGLLKDTDGSYYYKGTNTEVSNNFVWFAGHLWRVISIDSDNNLTMITQQPITAISLANSVWTTEAEYEASYINHWLNSEDDGVFYKSLTGDDKAKILNSTFNVGGEYNSTTKVVENINSITTSQKVGLLDETQYTKAGGRDSFLDIKEIFWLGNRFMNGQRVRQVNNSILSGNSPTMVCGVRPVIKISNLTITAGKGTLDDPYRGSSTTTSTTNIKVGEYISIKTSGTDCGEDKRCLFRVVSKDNNSIKVTLNGLLTSTSKFAESLSDVTYTSGNTIDTLVTTFANTIDSKYRYAGVDKTFGIGPYGHGANYTTVQNTTYTGNIGLPVVGEMFTANDIDISTSTTKTFVNVDTIENPEVSDSFWTMTLMNTTSLHICYNNSFRNLNASYTNGVRPVLFLKNSLNFTGGEGTAENPFTLE